MAVSKHRNLSAEKSVRLTASQASVLARAAEKLGLSQSEFIREAILLRCSSVLDKVTQPPLDVAFPGIIGVATSVEGAPHARDAKSVFAEDLGEKLTKRRRIVR